MRISAFLIGLSDSERALRCSTKSLSNAKTPTPNPSPEDGGGGLWIGTKWDFARGFVWCVSALLTMGCDRGGDVPQTYTVQGTVTYQGQIVKGAQVSFVAVSPGEDLRGANGTTDAEGLYTLRTYFGGRQSADGALPGEYQVGILALDTARLAQGRPSTSTRPKNLIPDKYADPKASGLTATVLEEHGQRVDFDLDD